MPFQKGVVLRVAGGKYDDERFNPAPRLRKGQTLKPFATPEEAQELMERFPGKFEPVEVQERVETEVVYVDAETGEPMPKGFQPKKKATPPPEKLPGVDAPRPEDATLEKEREKLLEPEPHDEPAVHGIDHPPTKGDEKAKVDEKPKATPTHAPTPKKK